MDFTAFREAFLTSARQVIILYIMVAVGFICDKTGLFTEKTARASNNLLFYVVTPCVIVESFLTTSLTDETAGWLLKAALGAVITHVVAIVITLPFFRDKNDTLSGVFKFASVYGNVGYMALPLAGAVLGETGIFLCSVGVAVFQLFCFTHGAFVMSRGGEKKSVDIKSMLLNPGVLGIAVGLPCFLLKIKLPDVIMTPISYLGDLNTPFAMVCLGTYMSQAGLKTLINDKRQVLTVFLKLIALPAVMLGVMKLTGFLSGTLLTACLIQAAAPCANNTVMFAAKYDRDTGTASKTVALSSLLSMITMPIIIALCGD